MSKILAPSRRLVPGKGLAIGDLLGAVLLQPDGLDSNEATRERLVPSVPSQHSKTLNLRSILRAEALKSVHGGLSLGVEVAGLAGASGDVGVALVDHHVDLAVDALLGEDDGVLKELTLGAEVHAVVQAPGPLGGNELITEAADVAVHGETLEVNVGQTKDSQSRGVVAV